MALWNMWLKIAFWGMGFKMRIKSFDSEAQGSKWHYERMAMRKSKRVIIDEANSKSLSKEREDR
jgi:hypothetical protein